MSELFELRLVTAARNLCLSRGQNPDRVIAYTPKADENGFHQPMAYSLAWELAVEELREAKRIADALRYTEGTP